MHVHVGYNFSGRMLNTFSCNDLITTNVNTIDGFHDMIFNVTGTGDVLNCWNYVFQTYDISLDFYILNV